MSLSIVANNASAVHSNHIETSWDDALTGNFPESPYRQTFRQAVQDVAAKAKEVLTDSHGRIDAAIKLVLAGDVKLLHDGTGRVASQSNGTVEYFVVNGACHCKDFPKAPSNFCKHRLAFGICKRASVLTTERLAAQEPQASTLPAPEPAPEAPSSSAPIQPATLPPLPEMPASMNCYVTLAGYRVQVTLRGEDEQQVLARLKALLKQFPAPEDPPQATAEPTVPEGWCHRHALQMTQQHNAKGAWWSHRLADGSWCKGK